MTSCFRQWTCMVRVRSKARQAIENITRIRKRQELGLLKSRFNSWLLKFESVSDRFNLAAQKLDRCLISRRALRFALLHWKSSSQISNAERRSLVGNRLAACIILSRVGSNVGAEAMRASFGILRKHRARVARQESALCMLARWHAKKQEMRMVNAWGRLQQQVVVGRAQDQLQALLQRMHDQRAMYVEQQVRDRGRVVVGLLERKRAKMVARALTVLKIKQHSRVVEKV
jgi:hypothetical protein